jgi:hypothetical protein
MNDSVGFLLKDELGRVHGGWEVIRRMPNSDGNAVWRVRCQGCGFERSLKGTQLRHGPPPCQCRKDGPAKRKPAPDDPKAKARQARYRELRQLGASAAIATNGAGSDMAFAAAKRLLRGSVFRVAGPGASRKVGL